MKKQDLRVSANNLGLYTRISTFSFQTVLSRYINPAVFSHALTVVSEVSILRQLT